MSLPMKLKVALFLRSNLVHTTQKAEFFHFLKPKLVFIKTWRRKSGTLTIGPFRGVHCSLQKPRSLQVQARFQSISHVVIKSSHHPTTLALGQVGGRHHKQAGNWDLSDIGFGVEVCMGCLPMTRLSWL